jgi:hypothetical protein
MQPTFDPVRKRKFWLDFNLAYEIQFEPQEIPAKGQAPYVSVLTNSLITAYLLGLADRVQPTLEAIVAWMEGRPEPNVGLFSETWEYWRDGWYALYLWRRTLGVCRWLCGIEGAEHYFKQALDADRKSWEWARPEDAKRDFHLRRNALPEHLALTLAANDPSAGLSLRAAAGVNTIAESQPPLLILGQYACLYLHTGNERDQQFDSTTTELLRRAMWPHLLAQGRYTEAALWLKAIYGNSGTARSSEQTIARAYDFLPGIKRPFFVPQ